MRIAFYAPLKSPNHAVPSGDRQMARLLIQALGLAGHTVELASELRAYLADPELSTLARVQADAAREIERVAAVWQSAGVPDLWVCYHPYYKAPDLLGPTLCERFGIPMITVEASYAGKRVTGPWAAAQALVELSLRKATLNLCFTARDLEGLSALLGEQHLAHFPPFIDVALFAAPATGSTPSNLIAIAMMRAGDKLDSYRMLGAALELCVDRPWTLSIVGDGPCRAEVEAAFAAIDPIRIRWLGERPANEIPAFLAAGDLYVWPGCGEAFGLAYLEAQAAGLPVVAQEIAGVPEVVRHGETGLLTSPGDIPAYAAAIRRLLDNEALRRHMGASARNFVLRERSLDGAAAKLRDLLQGFAP